MNHHSLMAEVQGKQNLNLYNQLEFRMQQVADTSYDTMLGGQPVVYKKLSDKQTNV